MPPAEPQQTRRPSIRLASALGVTEAMEPRADHGMATPVNGDATPHEFGELPSAVNSTTEVQPEAETDEARLFGPATDD